MNTNDGYKTPSWLYHEMEKVCVSITGSGFDCDAAGCEWNKQCATVITREMDTRRVDWRKYGKNFFLNPPYKVAEIGPIVMKAIAESERGATVGLIVPVWTNHHWNTELIRLGEVHEIVGPVLFEDHTGKGYMTNLPTGGRLQIRVIFIGPDVKAGTNGAPIYTQKNKPQKPTIVPKPSVEWDGLIPSAVSLISHTGSVEAAKRLLDDLGRLVKKP